MSRKKKMYVQLSIPDNDVLFSKTTNAILLNDLMVDTKLGDILRRVYDDDNDNPSIVASCPQGCTVGSYYDGTKCSVCGEIVTDDNGSQIRHDVWFSAPSRIGYVLHPEAYRVIAQWMGRIGSIGVLDSILDNSQELPEKLEDIIKEQGFIWFYNNFDYVMGEIAATKKGSKNTTKNMEIKLFLKTHGHKIWCTKFPLVSRILHPLVKSSTNRYVSKVTDTLVRTIDNLAFSTLSEKLFDDVTVDKIERKFFKIYSSYNKYLNDILQESVIKKPGISRKHIFGSRVFNTVRTVCVPIIEPHDLDEIHLAWAPSVKLLETILISMLINSKRYNHFQAYQKVERAIAVYDFEIDKLIQKIIKDSKYGGVPVILNRNPILRITGLIQLFITKVYPCLSVDPEKEFEKLRKENPGVTDEELGIDDMVAKLTSIKTLALSPGVLGGGNIDFDGDELNLVAIFEENALKELSRLHPRERMLSPKSLAIGSQDVNLAAQQSIMITAWANAPIGDTGDNLGLV